MSFAIMTLAVRYEHDLVVARRRTRQIAELLGFEPLDQVKLATAVSEISRNAFVYGGGGKVEFSLEGTTAPQVLQVRVRDQGPGIADLPLILGGRYRSPTGMGLGITGARRLVDRLDIETSREHGTTVMLMKLLTRRSVITPEQLSAISGKLLSEKPGDALEEAQQQNQEILRTLEELSRRQEELTRLNHELEDTNRGVVALYAELDEKADHLRRADDLKSRFLSNMSHEFRTPVNSIIALSRLLLAGEDGPLAAEQEKQVGYIQRAAEGLLELVSDLLDLAKVEAGKIVVRPAEFEVAKLFGALRGMLRPLLVNDSVNLVFDDLENLPTLVSDEGKVSQILRNFLSNAIKFTEEGQIRIGCVYDEARDAFVFSVQDTGIGIADADRERIFEEFTQIDHPVQRRHRGTGLGLPLSRRLAGLLGGRLSVASTLGEGSTFSLEVPRFPASSAADSEALASALAIPERLIPVLIVEDAPEASLLYERFLRGTNFHPIMARSVRQAQQVLDRIVPGAIVLDILLKGEDTWSLLASLKGAEKTKHVPVLVVTTLQDRRKALALGATAFSGKPVDRTWLLSQLSEHTQRAAKRILIIDDEDVSRYLLRQSLRDSGCIIFEAENGPAGVRKAHDEKPDAILLDLVMPDMSGHQVLEQLADDTSTRDIPIIVITSKELDAREREVLSRRTIAVLNKLDPFAEGGVRILSDALRKAGIGLREGP